MEIVSLLQRIGAFALFQSLTVLSETSKCSSVWLNKGIFQRADASCDAILSFFHPLLMGMSERASGNFHTPTMRNACGGRVAAMADAKVSQRNCNGGSSKALRMLGDDSRQARRIIYLFCFSCAEAINSTFGKRVSKAIER